MAGWPSSLVLPVLGRRVLAPLPSATRLWIPAAWFPESLEGSF